MIGDAMSIGHRGQRQVGRWNRREARSIDHVNALETNRAAKYIAFQFLRLGAHRQTSPHMIALAGGSDMSDERDIQGSQRSRRLA